MSSPLLQHNAQDPLNSRTEQHRELYRQLCSVASGFPMDHVVDGAFNLLVNGLRQTYGQRGQAEVRVNEICGQMKEVLLSHYDSVTGKRRQIFPHDQRVEVPTFVDRDKILR